MVSSREAGHRSGVAIVVQPPETYNPLSVVAGRMYDTSLFSLLRWINQAAVLVYHTKYIRLVLCSQLRWNVNKPRELLPSKCDNHGRRVHRSEFSSLTTRG